MLNLYLNIIAIIALVVAYFVFVPPLISAASTELLLIGVAVTLAAIPSVYLLARNVCKNITSKKD